MKRFIGLDLGTTSLGVSISDKTNTIVSPLVLIKFKKEDYNTALKELLNIIEKYNITDVVLGLPKNMDNSMGFAATRSINFKNMLEENNIAVHLEDERLTTVEAINIMKNNGVKKINKSGNTDIICSINFRKLYKEDRK